MVIAIIAVTGKCYSEQLEDFGLYTAAGKLLVAGAPEMGGRKLHIDQGTKSSGLDIEQAQRGLWPHLCLPAMLGIDSGTQQAQPEHTGYHGILRRKAKPYLVDIGT